VTYQEKKMVKQEKKRTTNLKIKDSVCKLTLMSKKLRTQFSSLHKKTPSIGDFLKLVKKVVLNNCGCIKKMQTIKIQRNSTK